MFCPKNIYSVLTPMYYITKIVGLTPFSIRDQAFKKSKLHTFWSIFMMLFLNIYTITSLNKRKPRHEQEIISKVTDMVDLILSQLAMIFSILCGCTSLNTILIVFEDINKFDLTVSTDYQIDLKKEYRKSQIYVMIGLIATLAYVALSLTVTSLATGNTLDYFGLFLAYVCPPIINSFVDFQFCAIVLCLKQRFKWLNRTVLAYTGLQNNFEKCGKLFTRVRPAIEVMPARFVQDKTLDVLEKIRINHHDLSTICKNLNTAYSIPILLIVVQSFTALIVLLYFAGEHILLDDEISVKYLVYCGTQLSLFTLQLVILVLVCSSTSVEARETGILIHKAMSAKEDKCKDDMQLEVALFSLQLLHHNVEFTACKMFVINEGLLFSIIGAVTTYLVIVIQFEIGSGKKS